MKIWGFGKEISRCCKVRNVNKLVVYILNCYMVCMNLRSPGVRSVENTGVLKMQSNFRQCPKSKHFLHSKYFVSLF